MPKKLPKRQPSKLSIDVVEARAFVLVDEFGNERAVLQCSGGVGGEGGDSTIQLKDDQGRARLEILVDKDGNPGVRFLNSDGSPAVQIASHPGTGNALMVCDAQGRPCIVIGIPGPQSGDPRGVRPDVTVVDLESGRYWSALDS